MEKNVPLSNELNCFLQVDGYDRDKKTVNLLAKNYVTVIGLTLSFEQARILIHELEEAINLPRVDYPSWEDDPDVVGY